MGLLYQASQSGDAPFLADGINPGRVMRLVALGALIKAHITQAWAVVLMQVCYSVV